MKKLLIGVLLLAACNKTDIRRPEPAVLTVYEYTPAPGQFINETATGGFTGAETTPTAAAAYAQARLEAGNWVSLGGWGGSIVVGLGRIENGFSIRGNMYKNSSEPGIVYVMQDTDGNGRPDDVWYELKGSEYGAQETIRDYEVTYYRPDTDNIPIRWTDNRGNEGTIDHMGIFGHSQPSYYPAWITTDSYTLHGTRLANNAALNGATWEMAACAWGYADNFGEDASDGWNTFLLSNAVGTDGMPANLSHADFIKVQTGVNAKAGVTGEISTEVAGFSI